MNKKLLTIATISILTLSACGTAHISEEHLLENYQNKQYSSVNVHCYYDEEEAIFPDFNRRLENYIRTYLEQENVQLGDDLLIRCNYVNFRAGSRAGRYLGASYSSRGESDVQVELIDAENNKIDEFRVKSLLMFGFFGGNSEDLFKNSAKKIVERVKTRITQSPQTTTK